MDASGTPEASLEPPAAGARAPGFWFAPVQFTGTQETSGHLFFKSAVVRWAWRFYTQRLTQAGRWFLWPSLAFLGYSLSSLDLQPYVVFSYIAGIWLVALVSGWLFRPQVRMRIQLAPRTCAGEVLEVEAEVEQAGRTGGIDLRVLPHRLPAGIEPVPSAGAALPPLARDQQATVKFGLRCTRRGAFNLRGFKVETDFPFGLLRAYQPFEEERSILVYPRFTPLARCHLPSGRRYQPGGVALASPLGDSTEFIGNREFREGDNVRDIDWRATARLNLPIVREYREEYFVRVALILDTQVPARTPASRRLAFEGAVSLCAALGDFLARQEYLVDLFAAGPDLYHLTAGRGLAYLDQILDILACVDSTPQEPFQTLEPEIVEHLAQISAVVAVFLDWDEPRRNFLQNLGRQGTAVKALIIRDGPCTLDPVHDADLLGAVPVFSPAAVIAGLEEL